jgi:hypothetical protein
MTVMETIRKNGFERTSWAPAPYLPPPAPYGLPAPARAPAPEKRMGAITASGLERLFADPTLAFLTSVVAAVTTGYLGYGLSRIRQDCLLKVQSGSVKLEACPGTTWSTFWWIVSTAMGVKALHDLSRTGR